MSNANSLFIGVPSMGKIRTELALLLTQWKFSYPHLITIQISEYFSPEPAARNYLVSQFLRSKAERLLMIDADVVPPLKLLDLMKFDLDIVSPLIFILYGGNSIPLVLQKQDGKLVTPKRVKGNSLVKVDGTGTGCILIKRGVIEKIRKPIFEFGISENGSELLLGEDLNFCQKAIEAGFKIFVHSGYVTSHWNTVDLTTIGLKNG